MPKTNKTKSNQSTTKKSNRSKTTKAKKPKNTVAASTSSSKTVKKSTQSSKSKPKVAAKKKSASTNNVSKTNAASNGAKKSTSTSAKNLSSDNKNWAILAHLSALAGFVVPLGNVAGPLVIWMVKKDSSDYVSKHSIDALNFQISITLYLLVSGLLSMILIGIPFFIFFILYGLYGTVKGAVYANNSQFYVHKFTFKFLE